MCNKEKETRPVVITTTLEQTDDVLLKDWSPTGIIVVNTTEENVGNESSE